MKRMGIITFFMLVSNVSGMQEVPMQDTSDDTESEIIEIARQPEVRSSNNSALLQAHKYLRVQRYAQAMPKLMQAADSDDAFSRAEAWYLLGQLYSTGKGTSVPKSLSNAREYLSKAANQNDNEVAKNKATSELLKLRMEPETAMEDVPELLTEESSSNNESSAISLMPNNPVLLQGQKYIRTQAYSRAIPLLMKVADSDDVFAQAEAWYLLGQLYKTGKGTSVPRDVALARDFLSKAANQNNNEIAKNKAITELNQLEANPGNSDLLKAHKNLREVRYARAIPLLMKVANSDDSFSQAEAWFLLGQLYSTGRGTSVSQNIPLAREFLLKAANQNNNEGSKNKAVAELHQLDTRAALAAREEIPLTQLRSEQESKREAVPSFGKIQGEDVTMAEQPIGLRMPPLMPEGEKKISEQEQLQQNVIVQIENLNRIAREATDPNERAQALFGLGLLYFNGQVVPKDLEGAYKIFEQIVAMRNINPQLTARASKYTEQIASYTEQILQQGIRYTLGQGVPLDYREARRYFDVVAGQRINSRARAQALFNLGILHGKGLGMPQNTEDARKYLALAATQNDDPRIALQARNALQSFGHTVGIRQEKRTIPAEESPAKRQRA